MIAGRTAEWILYVTLLHFFCCSQGLVSDGDILLEFKSNVFDRLNSLGTWGSPGEDPCHDEGGTGLGKGWVGVSCDNMSGSGLQVSILELRSLSLASDDVSGLFKLESLKKLDLRDNSFSGKLPDVSKLENLTHLYLGNNQFTGPLADRFPPKLLEIDVQNNLLTGEIGTTNLFQLPLERLDLHGNNFSGRLPDMSFSGIQALHLKYFDVSGNQFEGPLPSGLTRLHMLYCNMSGNSFTGTIKVDQERGWLSTEVLDLSRNRLYGNIPAKLFMSSGMTYLDLSDNDLEGPIPSVFSEEMRTQIQYLYLQKNWLTGGVYNLLTSNLSSLVELRLHSGYRSDRDYEYDLFFNFTSETFPLSAINQTVSLPRLRVLDLSNCHLKGNIPSHILNPQALPSLRILDLSGNLLNGTVPAGLSQMPRLRVLRLGRNYLSGRVDRNWTKLEVLDLSYNQFDFDTKTIEDMLNFPHMKELRLGGNWGSFILLPTLERFNRSLEALEILDLSWLGLLGTIPSAYSSREVFPSLKYLDLSRNILLTGPVPPGFINMTSLTYLDLSMNDLTGEIPPLPPILLRGQFFYGNAMLCGPPLDYCSTHKSMLPLVVTATVCVLLSGGSCLFLGWIWRRRTDTEILKHKQDAELIAALLDRDNTSLMPLRQLRNATDDFSDENQVGVGGFGVVYRGVLDDGTLVAIKKSKRDGSNSGDKCQFLNEVKILSQVHHRNLVRLLGCCLANKNALLVFEFVPNGTLHEHLHSKGGHSPLTWNQRLVIAIQTANALDYLHSSANPPIYHLDVKSANILLDNNLNAKVADFGISKLAPAIDATHISTLHGFQGTFGYMDPEMVLKSVLTGKSDVYAFGVVLLELITAKTVVDRSRGEEVSLVKWAGKLIQTRRLEEMIDPVILDTFRTPDGKESIDAVARLAMDCLVFRSEDRPTMKDATRDLLCIQQRTAPPSSRRASATRNDEILRNELSSSVGRFTM